mgnify:CR=1 FL=1
MEQEGVTLPEQDYEDGHSKNGELQILYLAVSGQPARHVRAALCGRPQCGTQPCSLQRENIRLLVTSKIPA